jgi:DNA-binding transcriptional regulator YdaS (Cro superfamily)
MSKAAPRGRRNPIVRACQVLDCTQAELARQLGCTRAAVSKAKGLGEVSWSLALKIEKITSGRVNRYEACPRTYGPPPAAPLSPEPASPRNDEKQASADAA